MSSQSLSESGPSTPSSAPTRARGRGKSRGGLGKYLRARGRGGRGRPAEFGKRLVLEDEEEVEFDPDSEEAREFQNKYSKRHLGSNTDRYAETEPVLNSDGEAEVEPEVDLSTFLERQRLNDLSSIPRASEEIDDEDDDDVDPTLAHLSSKTAIAALSRKGKVKQIAWDEHLEEMTREKTIAEAQWDLKSRFRANATKRNKLPARVGRAKDAKVTYVEAPPLPDEIAPPPKKGMEEMENFLDDLLG